MNLLEFYQAVLPPTGHYSLFNKGPENPAGRHVWFSTLAELVAGTEKRAESPDWYFAVGSFITHKRAQANVAGKKSFYLDIDAGEEKWKKNPNTAYRNLSEAVQELSRFCAATGLAPSIVVHSGGGLHVYYVLSETLPGPAWEAIAEKIKRATKAAGFKADPTSTSDSARILRPPGTTHWSGAKVKIVRATDLTFTPQAILDGIARIPIPDAPAAATGVDLSDFDAAIDASELAGRYDADSLNDDIRHAEPIPTSAVKIATRCPALAEIAECQGNVTEPLWRAMLGLVKHTVEGAKIAHQWSEGHPEYDYLSTQDKYDRYAAGPPLCETFGHYSDKCRLCEHRGQIKSPIVLGRLSVEDESKPSMAAAVAAAQEHERANPTSQAPVPQEIPEGVLGENYKVHDSGNGLYTLLGKCVKTKKDGNETVRVTVWIPFTQDVFWLTGWTEAGRQEHENSNLSLVLLRRRKFQPFDLPNETTADRRALLKFLNSKTINPLNYEQDTLTMMQQYVNDQIRRVKEAAAKPVVRDHLGFHMDANGELYCAHGEYLIRRDGSIQKATLASSLETVKHAMMIEGLPPVNTGAWGRDAWAYVTAGAKRQQEFYRTWWGKSGLEVAQLAIMMQVASPLLVFAATTDMVPGAPLPAIGLTVSLFSTESAKGKTAMQVAATYAFGDPASFMRQGDRLGMTFNAQIAMAASLGTFPFPMDEVTTNDAQQVGESINRIASGIEKLRAGKDGHVARAPVSWALVSTVSTNVPQRELVGQFQKGSDALQMRLIELNCDVLPTRTSGVVPEYDAAQREAMYRSKGNIGALIHLYCCMHGYDAMRKKTLDKLRYVTEMSPGEAKERFILRGIAATLVLADILREMKLEFFDQKVLEAEAVKALGGARDYSLSKEPASAFLSMVRDLAPRMLITAADLTSELTPLENERTVRLPYAGRVCREVNVLYLSCDAVKEWALEQGMSPSAVMNDAKAAGYLLEFAPGANVGGINLGRGIRGAWTPRMYCWKVNASRLRQIDDTHGGNVVPLARPVTVSNTPVVNSNEGVLP